MYYKKSTLHIEADLYIYIRESKKYSRKWFVSNEFNKNCIRPFWRKLQNFMKDIKRPES